MKEPPREPLEGLRVPLSGAGKASPILPPPVNPERDLMDALRKRAEGGSFQDPIDMEAAVREGGDPNPMPTDGSALLCPLLDREPCLGSRCALWSWKFKQCSFQVQNDAYLAVGDLGQGIQSLLRGLEPLFRLLHKFR